MSIYRLNMLFHSADGDDRIVEAVDWLENRYVPEGQTPAKMARRYAGFRAENGQLWHQDRRVVTNAERPELLKAAYEHDPRVHGKGIVSLYKLVSTYYLNITRADIAAFLAQNAEYNIGKQPPHRVNKPTISNHPNSLWACDLIDWSEFLPWNRRWRYIITVTDVFSRFTWLARLKNKEAASVGQAFSDICDRAGIRPDSLMTDNGTEFAGEFDQILAGLGVRHRRTRSYAPQANGVVEARNKLVRTVLRSIMLSNANRVWYTHLADAEAAVNSTYNSTIRAKPVDVWVANKQRLARRNFPPAVVAQNPQLAARMAVRTAATRAIRAFRAHDYELNDYVRVKMSVIFSQVRAMVKARQTKNILCVFTPDIFQIVQIVRPRQQTLERHRYILRNTRTGHILTHPNGTGHHQCYASDLTPADPAEETGLTML